MFYYTATPYLCHDMELGTTELHGPFKTQKARIADLENKRQEDDWNLEEDGVTILFLKSTTIISAGKILTPTAAVLDEDNDDADAGIGVDW